MWINFLFLYNKHVCSHFHKSESFQYIKKTWGNGSWITYFEILALIISVALPLKTALLSEVNFIFLKLMLKHIEQ